MGPDEKYTMHGERWLESGWTINKIGRRQDEYKAKIVGGCRREEAEERPTGPGEYLTLSTGGSDVTTDDCHD